MLDRGMNLVAAAIACRWLKAENLFKEKDPVVRKWRSEYDPEHRRDFMDPVVAIVVLVEVEAVLEQQVLGVAIQEVKIVQEVNTMKIFIHV